MRHSLIALSAVLCIALAGCGDVKKEASYPTRNDGSDKIVYSTEKRDTVWGEGKSLSDKLFGRDDDKDGGGSGIGVNSFLWRASLDTISFMPVASADPFGGVILTDWYENPETPGQRFKLGIYIMDKQLRADGVRVAVFKQAETGKGWKDTAVPDDMATNIENAILTRARELRVAQSGREK
jgi:predicted component of type VI protein secretion system